MHISALLIDSFPTDYCSWRCAKEKWSILLEAHDRAQSGENFQSFCSKNLKSCNFLSFGKSCWNCILNPIQARGHIVPPHQNHSTSSKQLVVWIYCFVTFLSMYFPFRKVQFHQSALKYVAMATIQLFGLISKTRMSIVFKSFHLRQTFCGMTFYALDIIIL